MPAPRQRLCGIGLRERVLALPLVHGCDGRKPVESFGMLGTQYTALGVQVLSE